MLYIAQPQYWPLCWGARNALYSAATALAFVLGASGLVTALLGAHVARCNLTVLS